MTREQKIIEIADRLFVKAFMTNRQFRDLFLEGKHLVIQIAPRKRKYLLIEFKGVGMGDAKKPVAYRFNDGTIAPTKIVTELVNRNWKALRRRAGVKLR